MDRARRRGDLTLHHGPSYDRWAEEGREDVDNVRWDGPSPHPTFSWTDEGVEHRCSMNNTLRTRVYLKVSELQLLHHKNCPSEFLNREDNSRNFLGSTGKTKPSRTGLKGAFYKASVTHVPNFSSSGVFETAMSADFVNATTRR